MAAASPSLVEIDPRVPLVSVLPDRLCALLKQQILTCELRPGLRLVEKELCSRLRVSRTPLREALNRLVFEGLVVTVPYRGYAVAPLTIEGIRELCEVRRINEPAAVWHAARHVTDSELDQLQALAVPGFVIGDRESYVSYLRANSAFHLGIVRCARNRRLEAIVMTAIDQLQRPDYLGLGTAMKDTAEVSTEHRRIVEALRSRDGDAARRLALDHIDISEQRIITALTASEYWRNEHVRVRDAS